MEKTVLNKTNKKFPAIFFIKVKGFFHGTKNI
jgi:hypothetical protein